VSARTRELEDERRRRRRTTWTWSGVGLVIAVGAVVAVIALGGDDGGPPATTGPALTVSMVEMAFEPDPIEVPAGDAVLRVVNDGAVGHSMLIPELGKGTPDLKPGQELTLDLSDAEPGEYYVYCDITGHREAGMETTLVLTDD
jgi:plastocyanin